jgi:iron complex transport system substrate-binding protein
MAAGPRVLSLLSASTEIVHRLGASHLLVGRSHGCDDPPLATALPIATAPRVDPNAPSAEIDALVRAQAVAGGPIYRIHSPMVKDLRPDIIITQEQCRICAVTPDDVRAACAGLPPAKMVVIKPVTLEDVFGDVRAIATAIGMPERGERLVEHMRQRMDYVALQTKSVTSRAIAPKVAHVEWLAPVMGSGYWIAECVQRAGCTMIHGEAGGHSPVLPSFSALSDAELLIVAPCGFSIERTRLELAAVLNKPEWLVLPAVKAGRVFIADGNKYFNRSSCGVVETSEMTAEMAWTELVGLWGHHGKNWVRLSELNAFCNRVDASPPTKRVDVAEDPELSPDSERTGLGNVGEGAALHVERQVEHLRAGKFLDAFNMNSTDNRDRIGGVETFESLVKSNSSFAALTDSANKCQYVDRGLAGVVCTVEARLQTAMDGVITLAFDVTSSPEGAYETEGVRIVC